MASGESPSSLMVSERKREEAEFPPGFRFCPYDWELIESYVKDKNNGVSLRIHIPVIDLYNCHPERLQDGLDQWKLMKPSPHVNQLKIADMGEGDFKYAIHNEKYFFTRRVRKNRRGSQVKRSMVEGSWKTTSKDIDITDEKNNKIGYLKKFKFFEGKDKKPTNWLMHEFRDLHTVSAIEATTSTENWISNRYVLCKIYEKRRKHSTDSPSFTQAIIETGNTSVIEEVRESSIPENNPIASQPHQTSSLLLNMIQFQTQFDDNNIQHHLSTEVGLPMHRAVGNFNEFSVSQELLDCNDNGAEGSSIPQNTSTASHPHQTSLLFPNMNQFCKQSYENNIQDNASTKEGLAIHRDENIGNIHESFVSQESLDYDFNDPLRYWNESSGEMQLFSLNTDTDAMFSGPWSY